MDKIQYIYLSGVLINILIGLIQNRDKNMNQFIKEDALFVIGTGIFSYLMTITYVFLFFLDLAHHKVHR